MLFSPLKINRKDTVLRGMTMNKMMNTYVRRIAGQINGQIKLNNEKRIIFEAILCNEVKNNG